MSAAIALTQVTATNPVTEPPRVNIVLARGQSKRIRCTVSDSAGAAVSLAGKTLYYAWARRPGATPTMRECPTVEEADGTADLVFAASDTEDLTASSYAARFWLVDGAGTQEPVSAVSTLTLTEAVADFAVAATVPTGEGTTLTIRDEVTFTADDEVAFTFADAAEFADALYHLDVSTPIVTDDSIVTVTVSSVTVTGFTLTASAAFTGRVPFTAIGESA